mmetsp:Transcript_400/g.638  ORF Transcript_400/g.638 Transcript_400/m.638 type:complete len:465 (+) Transcript_400:195-1589(+)
MNQFPNSLDIIKYLCRSLKLLPTEFVLETDIPKLLLLRLSNTDCDIAQVASIFSLLESLTSSTAACKYCIEIDNFWETLNQLLHRDDTIQNVILKRDICRTVANISMSNVEKSAKEVVENNTHLVLIRILSFEQDVSTTVSCLLTLLKVAFTSETIDWSVTDALLATKNSIKLHFPDQEAYRLSTLLLKHLSVPVQPERINEIKESRSINLTSLVSLEEVTTEEDNVTVKMEDVLAAKEKDWQVKLKDELRKAEERHQLEILSVQARASTSAPAELAFVTERTEKEKVTKKLKEVKQHNSLLEIEVNRLKLDLQRKTDLLNQFEIERKNASRNDLLLQQYPPRLPLHETKSNMDNSRKGEYIHFYVGDELIKVKRSAIESIQDRESLLFNLRDWKSDFKNEHRVSFATSQPYPIPVHQSYSGESAEKCDSDKSSPSFSIKRGVTQFENSTTDEFDLQLGPNSVH